MTAKSNPEFPRLPFACGRDNLKASGTIFFYFVVMSMIVAGGRILIQNVPKPPELETRKQGDHKPATQPRLSAAGRRAQIQNAILVACCAVGAVVTGLAIVCVATLTAFQGGTAPGLFGALASLFTGGFIGFLFSIPSENQLPNSALRLNTSLNQIAEWLTKIIVGVSLVNTKTAYDHFVVAANILGSGLAISPTTSLPAAAIIKPSARATGAD